VPNRSSKRGQGPKDFNQIAHEVVQKAIGEMPKEEPSDPSNNAAAVTLGPLGGLKGGKPRAESLTQEKRKAIAKKAAETRWKKAQDVKALIIP
jgi:hypothetical protein